MSAACESFARGAGVVLIAATLSLAVTAAPERQAEKDGPAAPARASGSSTTILIPAGAFLMGTPEGDSKIPPDEKPQRRVVLEAFRIDRYEVTNAEYRKFLAAVRLGHPKTCHPAEVSSKDHEPDSRWWNDPEWNAAPKPVMGVDWFDAYAYCAWAGKRLPTEAEWEKAARGTDGRTYPWGSTFPGGVLLGNFADETVRRSNPSWTVIQGYDDGFAHTAPVGSFPGGASPYGVEDMAGNVWEWVADWYSSTAYQDPNGTDPRGPAQGTTRVLRGGSWDSTAQFLHTTRRHQHYPTYRGISFGIRCAQEVP